MCLGEGGDKLFFFKSRDHMINESRDSMSNRTKSQKYICITNRGKLVLQIVAALFYYKLGQMLLQIGAASLLQIRASVVTIRAAIAN